MRTQSPLQILILLDKRWKHGSEEARSNLGAHAPITEPFIPVHSLHVVHAHSGFFTQKRKGLSLVRVNPFPVQPFGETEDIRRSPV
jgi:hypothetical protein